MLLNAIGNLESHPVEWLWPGRLALGKLAILDGDPGLGKSLVTLDLCARLSRGRPFPDGTTGPGCAEALVLNGEDNAADTIRPRLQALDADLQRVFVLRAEDTPEGRPLNLPSDTTLLDDALTQTRARLLVIDPITAFLGRGVQSSNDTSVRRALLPLAQLAERHNTAVLMVRHLNKSRGRSPLYRGGGSIGFLAACRSGWLVARHRKEPAQCVLAQVKNNLAPPQPSLAYQVQKDAAENLALTWLGPTDWTAAQLLTQVSRRGRPSRPRQRARKFLQQFLRDGPHTSREIWAAAQRKNLSAQTLERARKELSIRCETVRDDGQDIRYWLLPDQHVPRTADAGDDELDRWFAEMREKYPPPSPLDEME